MRQGERDRLGSDAGSQIVPSAFATSDDFDRRAPRARSLGQSVEHGIAMGWVVVEEDESANRC
jgi:hypothetical protein